MTTLLLLLLMQGPKIEPTYMLNDQQQLMLSLPSSCLNHPKVKKQLFSGLTATLAISLKARDFQGNPIEGISRVDVRFEPWDEIFMLTLWQNDGQQHKLQLPSFKELVDWFAAYHMHLATLPARAGIRDLETTLVVLPFSQSERENTKRWFAKTLSNQNDDRRDPNKVLDLLVATSIKRKSMVRFHWEAEVMQ